MEGVNKVWHKRGGVGTSHKLRDVTPLRLHKSLNSCDVKYDGPQYSEEDLNIVRFPIRLKKKFFGRSFKEQGYRNIYKWT